MIIYQAVGKLLSGLFRYSYSEFFTLIRDLMICSERAIMINLRSKSTCFPVHDSVYCVHLFRFLIFYFISLYVQSLWPRSNIMILPGQCTRRVEKPSRGLLTIYSLTFPKRKRKKEERSIITINDVTAAHSVRCRSQEWFFSFSRHDNSRRLRI